MRLEWILHPAACYAALAVGMALCLYLFLSIKSDMSVCEARWARKFATLEAEYCAKMETLDERWKELSQISNLLAPPAPLRSGLNISKRSQAMQMARRGETPEAISAVLSIPLNEVELLIKVQQLTRGASA